MNDTTAEEELCAFADGYRDLLADAFPDTRWMNHPRDIALMFDKPACQRMLRSNEVRTPDPVGFVYGYDELRQAMKSAGVARVFARLPWGFICPARGIACGCSIPASWAPRHESSYPGGR